MSTQSGRSVPRSDAPGEAYDRLRGVLHHARFEERDVRARLGIASMYEFRFRHEGRLLAPIRDALDALVRLFLDAEPVSREDVDARLPAGIADLLKDLDLVRDHPDGKGLVPNVLLYPLESLLIASDLPVDPLAPHAGASMAADAVYPALTSGVRSFLETIPTAPCDAFLELCSGTGIAALRAARSAGRVWAVDIAERSTAFARFNARLNGIENATIVTGDLYGAVGSETFDRIVAHPPYVPSEGTSMIYRDGGEDGEHVTRGIVAGLPAHLRPGGDFHCTCVMTDRETPVEARVREMLGPQESEFDVVVLTGNTRTPTALYEGRTRAGVMSRDEARARIARFSELGIRQLVRLSMLVRRHGADAPAVTIRRAVDASTKPPIAEELLKQERLARSPR